MSARLFAVLLLLPTLPLLAETKVLARVAAGGGWETTIVFSNLSSGPAGYRLALLDASGQPATRLVKLASGESKTPMVQGALDPQATVSLTVGDDGPLAEGWSALVTDDAPGSVEGYAVLRHRAANGAAAFEAVVPFSVLQDGRAFVGYDNTQRFRTHFTLVNPGAAGAQFRLTYLNAQGLPALIDSVYLESRQQMTINVPNTYPDLADKTGMVMVEASGPEFAAAALRQNEFTGAVVSLPVMRVAAQR